MNTVFVTGSAGYIGTLLVERLLKRDDIGKIVCLDKKEVSTITDPKVVFISANLCESEKWMPLVSEYKPNIVIHTAWQIREMRFKSALQRDWNITGTKNVFDFCFKNEFVTTLVHYSTVASYGAFATNTFEDIFSEDDPLRMCGYKYADEKTEVETMLAGYVSENKTEKNIFVIRPASITGPSIKKVKTDFNLQSILRGSAKKSPVMNFIGKLFSVFLATKGWVRQFVHEDDVISITELLAFQPEGNRYEVVNASPLGTPTYAPDMARLVSKKLVIVPAFVIRLIFFILWNISLGKVPTSPGGWKSFSYPILVDGKKVENEFGHRYQYNSEQAFLSK